MQKLVASSLAMLMVAGGIAAPEDAHAQSGTATPIKHLVVIFDENISFDHYFGTYPNALNPANEPRFVASPGTPSVNGFTDGLLKNNPNALNTTLNGSGAVNPFRLDRSQAATADQDHDYTPEQEAFDHGLMDGFPKYTGTPGPPPSSLTTNGLVMGYYDGNTVTALWNYAQQYALDDNSYGTNFGPSTDGAINLISGQTNGVTDQANASGSVTPDGSDGYTLISDADPIGDKCSTTTGAQVGFSGTNIGDLLNSAGISWGWVDHTVTDQSSILRFIEDNWLGGQRITGSFDSLAGTLNNMFDFNKPPNRGGYQLNPATGEPTHHGPSSFSW